MKNIITVYRSVSIQLICSIALFFLILPGYGSEKERQIIAHIPGVRLNAERDLAYSPLLFSGVQGNLTLGYSSERISSSDYLVVHISSGKISNSYGNSIQGITAGIQTYKFYHGEKDPHSRWNWGWSNNNEFNTRDIQDIGNFNDRNEYFTSFGPAVRYRLPFTFLNRDFRLELLSHFQLLGFKLQSSYVSSLPRGFEEPANKGFKGFINSIDLFHPGNSLNAGFQPSLGYKLRSGNLISITYRYDYLRLAGAHTVEKSRGSWSVAIITVL
jgi:hypothetical protein